MQGRIELHVFSACSRNLTQIAMETTKERLQIVCGPGLAEVSISSFGSLRRVLWFHDEMDALKSVVGLWRLNLEGSLKLYPLLCHPPILTDELEEEISQLFLSYIQNLSDGALVKQKSQVAESLREEMSNTDKKLRRRKKFWSLNVHADLTAIRKNMSVQLDHSRRMISEFKSAMHCLERWIVSGRRGNANNKESLFKLKPLGPWSQLYCILERETARLRAELPLYARREEILSEIRANQIVVLIGETGSGKSTQLVQYLYDAGFGGNGKSIVCTQPRKVAVRVLTQRVAEESEGCAESSLPVGCITTAECHPQLSDIVFTTDKTLLRLCLSDRLLRSFSCVLVDEAHERSLDTDLLLAMLKGCTSTRRDLKLVIMSATADAELLSAYFGDCKIIRVPGKLFPVKVIYEPDEPGMANQGIYESQPQYLSRVIKKVSDLHMQEESGGILAFLTSPAEVEWACGQMFGNATRVLPLHGKLQQEDLQKVFQVAPVGQRKIVFATNFAETSLTIPQIKFVVDSGMAKNSIFDPQTGVNVLKVERIDRSSALQRMGRAGRTESGVCYCLYSQAEFADMCPQKLPEIRRVHLGVAILKIYALGISDVAQFDFIDAPNEEAVHLAVQNLEQIQAVQNLGAAGRSLTVLGRRLNKLAIEPRLGKILLDSIYQGYGQEGLVIAALMSLSKSLFYRSGSEEMKSRSDYLKMRFCHPHGDLFTMMSVYYEWNFTPDYDKKSWCLSNCVNSKVIRKYQDLIKDMRSCLKYELNLHVSCQWTWNPSCSLESSDPLRKIIFSAIAPTNLAVYSGHERVGYDVVPLGQSAHIHPSSAVLVYGHIPKWVVFGEIVYTTSRFLCSVTVVESKWVAELSPTLLELDKVELSVMEKWVVARVSKILLTRMFAKQGHDLKFLTSQIQCGHNHRCIFDPKFYANELWVFTSSSQMRVAKELVNKYVNQETVWMENECSEIPLVRKPLRNILPPVVVWGAGGMIRDVLMPGEFASVEVGYEKGETNDDEINDYDLTELFDKVGEGIAGYEKFRPCSENLQVVKWGMVGYSSRDSADAAVQLLNGSTVKKFTVQVKPALQTPVIQYNRTPFPAVKATLSWARRRRKGLAFVRCAPGDSTTVYNSCSGVPVFGHGVRMRMDRFQADSIVISGLDETITEKMVQEHVRLQSGIQIQNVFMPRSAVTGERPTIFEQQEELIREIGNFVPHGRFEVSVYEPKLKDYSVRAEVRFDESEHAGATDALAHLDGRVLTGLESWQQISYMRVLTSQVHVSRLICRVVGEEIMDLVAALRQRYPDIKLVMGPKDTGGQRIQISGGNMAAVAGCKSALEKIVEGYLVEADENLDTSILGLLFTKEGSHLVRTVEEKNRCLIRCDKRIPGAVVYARTDKKDAAVKDLVSGLIRIHLALKRRLVSLRGEGMPSGLMRELVKVYGPDLFKLQDLARGMKITIDHRRHCVFIDGNDMDMLSKIHEAIGKVAAQLSNSDAKIPSFQHSSDDAVCAICFGNVEDKYCLEGCGHCFCRSCLVDQGNSLIRHQDGFPWRCACDGCSKPVYLLDIQRLMNLDQQEDLLRASLSFFVGKSQGAYKFCTTPDCPTIYRASKVGGCFACAACAVEICTACHVENHEGLACEDYHRYKLDPDASLKEWKRGKEDVKNCPGCNSTIEKVDGCNHMTCKCGKHVCWVCLHMSENSTLCYDHLRLTHGGYN